MHNCVRTHTVCERLLCLRSLIVNERDRVRCVRSSLRERVHGAHCSAACALQIVYAAEKSCLWFRSLRTRIARLRLQPGPPRSSAQAAACARAQAHPLTRVPRANVPRAKANDEKPGTTAREFRKILHMLTEIYYYSAYSSAAARARRLPVPSPATRDPPTQASPWPCPAPTGR